MVEHLKGIAQKESIEASEDALHLIARKADGGLRDALSMFDQLVSFGGGKITYESAVDILSVLDLDTFFDVSNMLASSNISDALLSYDTIVKKGFDGSTFLGGMAAHFRNLAVSKETKTQSLLDVSESFQSKYIEQSNAFSFAFILNGLNLISEAEEKYKMSRNPRLLVELMLMKLGHLNSFIQNIPSLEEVKKKLANPTEAGKSASFKRAPSIVEDKPKPNIVPKTIESNGSSTVEQNIGPEKLAEKTSIPAASGAEISADSAKQELSVTTATVNNTAVNDDLVTSTRIKLKGFEQFKQMRTQQQTAVQEDEVSPKLDGNAESAPSIDIPNRDEILTPSSISNKNIDEAWVEFYQSQTTRVLTCLKSLKYEHLGNQLIITLNASHQESIIDEIRPTLMQMLKNQVPHLAIQSIVSVMGEIEVQERRPYTDKEKLEYLIKKHPGLGEALESLHLRLP
jgi:DNA polymerase-3 subunit gamma/tau